MAVIAIIGAGPIAGALAHKIAQRARVREVRLIDAEGSIAQGKALDILQSSPIENFSTKVTAADAVGAAAGADVIAIADAASGSEHTGDAGLALLRQIAAVDGTAPLLFVGTTQRLMMARAVSELHVRRERILGSAPMALESAARALTALALDGSGAEVRLRVVGVPPQDAVIAWDCATVSGEALASRLAAHHIAAVNARLPRLWPPGPYALASAAARVAEALVEGSRRQFSCFVVLDAGPRRHAVAAMPVDIPRPRTIEVGDPALTRQERTLLENAIERAG